MTVYLPNGFGDYPTGDSFVQAKPLTISGNFWYVDPVNGFDSMAPRGLDERQPLLTLTQALGNASDHDIIVLLGSVALTSPLAISKPIVLMGAHKTGGKPAWTVARQGGANVALFTITADDVQLRNLAFTATGSDVPDYVPVPAARIVVSGTRFRMVGCTVDSGHNDTGPALNLAVGASVIELRDCVFTSVSDTSQPESAIKSAALLDGLRIYSCTLDGGLKGYSNYHAANFSAAAITRMEAEGLSLLRGADMKLHAASTGWVHVEKATGGARVDW